jgi:hypothetical protein
MPKWVDVFTSDFDTNINSNEHYDVEFHQVKHSAYEDEFPLQQKHVLFTSEI